MNLLESKSRFLTSQPDRSLAKLKTGEQVSHLVKHLLFGGALLSVCVSTSKAEARHRYYSAPPASQVGCSDAIMHPCIGMDVFATQKNVVKGAPMRGQSLVEPP